MRDLKNKLTSGKNSRNIQLRKGKSFGYQVLGFGSSAPVAVVPVGYFGGRGVWCGGSVTGNAHQDVMDYITIASLGNATDFGNLTFVRWEVASCSNGSRGICAGGEIY